MSFDFVQRKDNPVRQWRLPVAVVPPSSAGPAPCTAARGLKVDLLAVLPTRTFMEPITDKAGFERVVALPTALLLKHGAHCPISANAREEVTSFASAHPDIPVYSLEVTENRDLSKDVAFTLEVHHESPQLFLLEKGKAKWHTEHYDISEYDIQKRLGAK
jgi:bacillithiol system protein YtxJ